MQIVALEYHDIVDGATGEAAFEGSGFPGGAARTYKMTATNFATHCDAVATSGTLVVNDVRTLPTDVARCAMFTFDDGGVSALRPTADILERFGWRGHFFITTGAIGTPGFLTTAQARELSDRGHVVGSHSHSHPVRMSHLDTAGLHREWRESVECLQDALGAAVTVASVPGGYYGTPVAKAAFAEGIRWLFTSEPVSRPSRVGECDVFGRYTLRIDSSPSLARALVSPGGTARLWQSAIWGAKKAAKRIGGDTYLRLRASLMGDSRDSNRGALSP
ncbi:MAG: polysaccharide deacetylase family protein [Gemmatimonadaceae bacterium]